MKETNRVFKIWKVTFQTHENDLKIREVDYFRVIGISRKGSLVIEDNFGKKRWIKEEYFNSTNSPIWKESINKPYGYIIREQQNNVDITKGIAFMAAMNIPVN